MENNYYRQQADKIGQAIIKSVNKDLKLDYTVNYGGRAISIENLDNSRSIWIWIRLGWNNDTCLCVISTVSLAPELQNRGYFTTIINALKDCKCIDNIMIENICSESMTRWCKKHRFKEYKNPYAFNSNYYWKNI